MILLKSHLALLALLLTSVPAFAEPTLPDASLPVSSLVANGNALLAAGDKHGALDHFDAALRKDPTNYLTLFKRATTYLSLGRSSQASADFDAILSLKPDFEAALLQRAKLKAKVGEWEAARSDYVLAGETRHLEAIKEIEEARVAAQAAEAAEMKQDWETCVEKSGQAIVVASQVSRLRAMRARCRIEKGDVHEAVGDLTHVAQLNAGDINPHLKIANLLYYSLNDYERATAQLRKCLHSDPDSKPCSRLFRRIKTYEKQISKARGLRQKRQFNSANKILIRSGEEDGVLEEVKEDVESLKKDGTLNEKCPQSLLADLDEMVCDDFTEMNKPEKAAPYCDEALKFNPESLPAILSKATRLIKSDLFEQAITLLNNAKENIPSAASSSRINQKLQEAHTLLRRSKTKDYYAVLGVSRDADERTIKKAYRQLTRKYHPDKYRGELSAEEVMKKQSALNEAYEVLGNPELKARFDAGDDPNSQEQQGNPFRQGGNPFGGHGSPFGFRQQQGNPFGQHGGGNPFKHAGFDGFF